MEPNQVANQAPVQSAPVVPKDSIVQDDNAKKGGKGAIIGMVIFAILAIGGIGFGVWTMMDGNTQKDALNNQISDLKKQNSELLEKLDDAGIDIDIDSDYEGDESVASTDGYIYIDGLGIKIKKPENWREMVREYHYYNDYPHAVDTFEIRENHNPGAGVYISITSASCGEEVATRRTCFTVGDMNIIVAQLVGELTAVNDSAISETFWDHFSNPENYSAI